MITTAPGEDQDYEFWTPYTCPCKETWVANGQPVWVAGTAYPGNYVVEHPAGSGNLYIPLESGGVSVGGGEPGIDIHWVLCDGQGPSPGPCEALNVPVWNRQLSQQLRHLRIPSKFRSLLPSHICRRWWCDYNCSWRRSRL